MRCLLRAVEGETREANRASGDGVGMRRDAGEAGARMESLSSIDTTKDHDSGLTMFSPSQCLHSRLDRRRRQRLRSLERALGPLVPHAASGGAYRVPIPEHPVSRSAIGPASFTVWILARG